MKTSTKRIEKTSETYIRRLCHEINHNLNLQDAVYFQTTRSDAAINPRITDVMFSNGGLWVKSPSWQGWLEIKTTTENMDAFFVRRDRRICASCDEK